MRNTHQADFLCCAVTGRPIIMPHSWASSVTWLLAITICTGEDVIRGTLTMSHICTKAVPQASVSIIPLSPPLYQSPLLSHGISAFAPFSFLKEAHYFHLPKLVKTNLLLYYPYKLISQWPPSASPPSSNLQPLAFFSQNPKHTLHPHLLNNQATLAQQFSSSFTFSFYFSL